MYVCTGTHIFKSIEWIWCDNVFISIDVFKLIFVSMLLDCLMMF